MKDEIIRKTIDTISKEEKLLNVIKQSRSFKALVSSFEDDEDIRGNLVELSFTRHYLKPDSEIFYDLSIKGMTREIEGLSSDGISREERKELAQKHKENTKGGKFIYDKLHQEGYIDYD